MLRGSERLLRSGRVRYLLMEYHPGMLSTAGTDHVQILHFLRHYCFQCYSVKAQRPMTFEEFGARYLDPSRLK